MPMPEKFADYVKISENDANKKLNLPRFVFQAPNVDLDYDDEDEKKDICIFFGYQGLTPVATIFLAKDIEENEKTADKFFENMKGHTPLVRKKDLIKIINDTKPADVYFYSKGPDILKHH